LTKPIEKLRGELEKQIEEGRNLLAAASSPSYWAHHGAWVEIEGRADSWYRYNQALLERYFTTYQIAQDYVNARGAFVTNFRDTRDKVMARRVTSITNQLNYLDGLYGRLELYVPPVVEEVTGAQIENTRPAQRPAAVPNNITINITG